MQCKRLSIRFQRALNEEESNRLISYFKGVIASQKEILERKKRGLNIAGMIGSKIGVNDIKIVQGRMDALITPIKNEDGTQTCIYERYFSLEWEESNPTEWNFYFPSPEAIFGMVGMLSQLRRIGISNDGEYLGYFNELLKESKLIGLLTSMKITDEEREL